jgi:hypothetical protein
VKDAKVKIAQILYENKKDIPLSELFKMSRLWKLEPGENVYELEKYFDSESYSYNNLPLQVRGKVLELNELLENMNIADNDVLMYEVQYSNYLKDNDSYAFT